MRTREHISFKWYGCMVLWSWWWNEACRAKGDPIDGGSDPGGYSLYSDDRDDRRIFEGL